MSEYLKGSFLFFDWCPAPNGVANLEYERFKAERHDVIVTEIRKEVEEKTEKKISSIDFYGREDGIILFFVNFERGVDFADLRNISRRISLLLKARCFGHRHTHHPDENTVLGNHHPVLCDLRSIIKTEDDFLDSANHTFAGHTEIDRFKFLKNVSNDNESLLLLKKAGGNLIESSQFAAIELKHFFAARHDETINRIDSFKTKHRRLKLSILIESSALSFITFIFVFMYTDSGILISASKSFLSGIIVFASYSYLRNQLSRASSILKATNEAIGFLARSSTYCSRISKLYEETNNPAFKALCFGTDQGFSGYVNSLEQIKDRYKSDLDRKLIVFGILLASAALIATLAAV